MTKLRVLMLALLLLGAVPLLGACESVPVSDFENFGLDIEGDDDTDSAAGAGAAGGGGDEGE